MKRITTLLFSLALTLTAAAVPAKRQMVTLTRTDGTTVTAYLMGDEHFHYYQTVETGEILFTNPDGLCYTPSAEALAQRRQLAEQRAITAEKIRARRAAGPRRAESLGDPETPFDLTGKKKALVMLVDFSDKPMTFTKADFDAQVNEVGYSRNGHHGSVHDYFFSQSYGQFDLSFDVVGPLRVSKKSTYYGNNDSNGDDMYPATMVAEACELAHEQGIKFSDYDWDGDGEAEMVICIYAGYGEAQSDIANTIWPHQWTLTESVAYGDGPGMMEFDGTYVDSYLVLNELNGSRGTKLDGIGTFCHEYSHSLGLPDIYNTAGGTTFGMDNWSLMDSGCYNADGYVPSAYTAYERMFCKWLKPTELKEGANIENMKAITSEPEAYIIYNEANHNEYYLLQNIQQTDWNEEAPGHGMLVMHVDYNKDVWYNNTVNNERNHRRCTIIPADNNTYTSTTGLKGDPFPGSTKNTKLTDTSTPAATLYNKNTDGRKFMGKPIEDITESFSYGANDGRISFTFNGGGSTEGISNVTIGASNEAIYNLNGQRISVANGTKGIYISNGKARLF